jgi:cellulose biosynthesis protein BcsQ
MTVRFDDSLGILAEVIVKELGESALTTGVALRDVSGRLSFFVGADLKDETLELISKQLRSELGPYARTDRVLAGHNDLGAKAILTDNAVLVVKAGSHRVRLLDRRLVGADWLRTPVIAAAPPPRFVFASLKGGVGRSTALSVAAADLASHGKRVLAIDLDMEAPGLGAMLLDDGTVPEFGIIDALVENGIGSLDEQFFTDLVGPSSLANRMGRIDVIPAFGRRSIKNPADVLAKIARAYAEDVRPDGTVATILDQVRELVDHFAEPTRYDAILIDARAGLHETTASSILGLGAEVLLFGVDEPQTFLGYSVLLSHLARFLDIKDSRPEWVDRITMVHGKAPSSADERAAFVDKCQSLFVNSGLWSHIQAGSTEITYPAEPFNNVPWDDDAKDEDVLGNEKSEYPEPVAILDNERFRQFDPLKQQDLVSEVLYRSSFGHFLNRINRSFPPDEVNLS